MKSSSIFRTLLIAVGIAIALLVTWNSRDFLSNSIVRGKFNLPTAQASLEDVKPAVKTLTKIVNFSELVIL